jgi:glycosyltransferase involved in cell wall biosynthesis
MTNLVNGILNEGDQPSVSILMNCYNGERYLREAIESVLLQSFPNWEIIFWDNQSTDTSAEIFKSYVDARFKYFYAPKHTVLYEARNYALENARGEFIAFLDVDDWWLPSKLESQIALFDDPAVGFVCSKYFLENQSKGKRLLRFKKNMPQGRVLDNLLRDYYVGLLTLVIRRTALSYSTMPFDSRYHIIGDFDLAIRLAATWEIGVIQEPLASCRLHDQNESSKHRELTVSELVTWCEEHAEHIIIGKSKNFHCITSKISYCKSVNSLLSGNKLEALKFMCKMPWGMLKWRLIGSLLLPTTILKHLAN